MMLAMMACERMYYVITDPPTFHAALSSAIASCTVLARFLVGVKAGGLQRAGWDSWHAQACVADFPE